jgi:Flp pilus assembly pilin Flp
MPARFKRLFRDGAGTAVIEYALLTALIALAGMTTVHMFGRNIAALYHWAATHGAMLR